jgi:PAS domain S-box-containing protein
MPMTPYPAPALLLADPDPDQAVTLMQLLRLEGYIVHMASSAEQAQQIARNQTIDVALIHERLPGRSGFALCRALHLGRPDLPILMLLQVTDEAVGTAFEAGATDFLALPVNPVVLSRRVARALSAARALTDRAALERRWTQSFEQHHAPKLLIDPADGVIVDANPAACTFYGYPREQFAQMRLKDLEALDRPAEEQGGALTTLFSARHRLAGGEARPVKVLSGPVEMDGRTLVLAIVVDQSKRARVEAAARAQRELQSMVMASAAVLMRTLALNEVLERMLVEVEAYVRSDAALLLMLNDGEVYVAAARGYERYTSADALKAFQPAVKTIPPLAWMGEQRRALLIPDTRRYTGWPTQSALRWVGGQVAAPLLQESGLLGFVLLLDAAPGRFSERDAERLMAFAGPAALALHAALIYESK